MRERQIGIFGVASLASVATTLGLLVMAQAAGPPPAGKSKSCPVGADGDLISGKPADVSLNPNVLARLIQVLRAKDRDIHGLAISRDCRIVVEMYISGVTRAHNHTIYSVTKSVVVTLAGTLLAGGKLSSFDVPVGTLMSKPDSVPARNWEKTQRIRFRNVLAMSSGLEYTHDPTGNPIYRAHDRFAYALQPAIVQTPGTHFQYSDGDASIAGAVVAAVAGTDILTYSVSALFKPLSFKNYDWWSRDPSGRLAGGWGMRLRVIDMIKLGHLYLEKGVWQDRRIITAAFIDQAWSPSSAPWYGLFWWRNAGHAATIGTVYEARGFKGQRILVIPRLNIVVALTANLAPEDEKSVSDLILDHIAKAQLRDDSSGRGQRAGGLLDEEMRHPFVGKPGNVVWPEDTPRPPD
jgi:CubicO group peptidase (beta-lactamase class C family)